MTLFSDQFNLRKGQIIYAYKLFRSEGLNSLIKEIIKKNVTLFAGPKADINIQFKLNQKEIKVIKNFKYYQNQKPAKHSKKDIIELIDRLNKEN